MRTIQEMREKHWSGVKTLWPEKRSKVAVRFCWEGFSRDVRYLQLVENALKSGQWDRANYYLTGVYCKGESNDDFWNQFA